VPDLPLALRALAHEAVVTGDGTHPLVSWKPSPPGGELVVLAGRATRVPQAAVTSGIQRIATLTPRRPIGWAHGSDLGLGEEAETAWHARGQKLQRPPLRVPTSHRYQRLRLTF
jgi:hypothetical protein